MQKKLPLNNAARTAILLGVYALYLLGFHTLYPLAGAGAAALGFAPPVVAGLLFGIRGSLVCGLLSFPLSISLFLWVGDQKNATNYPAAFVGNMTFLLVALGVAWLRGLVERVKIQAQALRGEHQALLEEMEKRRQAEERLAYEALHDPLTNLPNRRLFRDRLEHAVELNRRHPDQLFAVMYLDFDQFKTINDSLGHATGDQLLAGLAQRLKDSIRAMDTVARMGGDEFAIVLEAVKDEDEAIGIVRRIQENLAAPLEVQGNTISVTASIGIVLGLLPYPGIDDIIRDADTAMYSAKDSGKNGYKKVYPKGSTPPAE